MLNVFQVYLNVKENKMSELIELKVNQALQEKDLKEKKKKRHTRPGPNIIESI